MTEHTEHDEEPHDSWDGALADEARRTPFAVWSPHAEEVELVLVDAAPGDRHDAEDRWAGVTTHPMRRAPSGWWAPADGLDAALEAAGGPGAGYGYRVDGAGPFPDPRARALPDTVHGPARRVDPEAHDWQDGDWAGRDLAGAVIYELHVGTFTPEGTLDAAAERLEHLVDLGVDFVELLPVNGFAGRRNWGYDGVAWYAVDASYGGPGAYQRFVDACHRAGLGVLQDVVYNHLGPSGNYLGQFGPYFAGSTDWGESVNLDGPGSDEVRRYIVDNALMWMGDYHVDGLRLDAVHALHDTRAVHLLEQLAAETDALSECVGRPLTLIAESDLNDPRLITARAEGGAGGDGLAGQWSDDFHHALHVALTGETAGYYADFASLDSLQKVLNEGFFHDGSYSSFRGRHHGRPLCEHIPAQALVVSAQNHDQVGNRASGDRLAANLDEPRLAIAAALMLTGPFTPMLFQGEEWAASTPWPFFTAHREPELGQAVSAGRRSEFARMGWDLEQVPDPQDPATHASAVLDWDELGQGRHARLLQFHRRLAQLRRERAELTDPDRATTRARADAGAGHLRVDRGLAAAGTAESAGAGADPEQPGGPGAVVVLAAFGPDPMPVPEELSGHRLLAGYGPEGPLSAAHTAPRQVPVPGVVVLAR